MSWFETQHVYSICIGQACIPRPQRPQADLMHNKTQNLVRYYFARVLILKCRFVVCWFTETGTAAGSPSPGWPFVYSVASLATCCFNQRVFIPLVLKHWLKINLKTFLVLQKTDMKIHHLHSSLSRRCYCWPFPRAETLMRGSSSHSSPVLSCSQSRRCFSAPSPA